MTSPPFVLPRSAGEPMVPAGQWTFYADNSVAPYSPIGAVSVTSFTCNWELSGFGTGEAVIPIEQNPMTRLDLLKLFGYRLWALYNDTVVWAGLATGLTDTGGPAVTVALVELPGYLNYKQYATTNNYFQIEQTQIANDLAFPVSYIGVNRTLTPGAGRLRTRNYTYLQGASRAELLSNLAHVINGPEFRAEYALDSASRPTCALHIAYPRVGSNASGLAL